MRLGSLFSGIGGLELGLERAGMEVVWNSEIEPFPCEVLKHHWPGVPNLGDITKVDWSKVQPVDVICGGFPCQDISSAGNRAGIKEGTRSGLWSYYHEAIRILQPRYAVIENVSAITIRGLDRVLCDLAEIGYNAEWRDIRASDMGAPHRRERIFIVAYPQRDGWGNKRKARNMGSAENPQSQGRNQPAPPPGNSSSPDVPYPGHHDALTPTDGRSIGEGETQGQTGWQPIYSNHIARSCTAWEVESDVGRVADGVPDWVAKLKALGNAVVPQCAEYVGRRIMQHAGL